MHDIMTEIGLTSIDTPKRTSLQHDLTTIRRQLKDFEKRFFAEHGRKPQPADVKQNAEAAAKYKKYNRIQDCLAGKLRYEDLEQQPVKKRRHERRDSAIGLSPGSRQAAETPKRQNQPHLIAADDELETQSPMISHREAIGPTPHRDGKLLGLFDCLDHSGSSLSSSSRKRKIDALYGQTPVPGMPLKTIQTPSRRSEKKEADLFQFLQGTPMASKGGGRLSRTPQSEGRKFQLSQFFATPTTQRLLFTTGEQNTQSTPLRDAVLGRTPQRQPDTKNVDTTPTYLKRSTSFKDRLLSATQDFEQKTSINIGPPTLKRFRSSTSNVLASRDLLPNEQTVQLNDSNDYDDDLEALREMEGDESASIVPIAHSRSAETEGEGDKAGDVPTAYKKKGQKRTTKKATIKPVSFTNKVIEPCFVTADESDDDHDDVDDHDQEYSHARQSKEVNVTQSSKLKTQGNGRTVKSSAKKQAGMINPNALSHANFRTLKIKNKNSRAKNAGKGRFNRRR